MFLFFVDCRVLAHMDSANLQQKNEMYNYSG